MYSAYPYGIDYCDKPKLADPGLTADEIPKACTPGCRADQWPAPVLAGCTEPLPPAGADLRGLWQAEEGLVGHVERIDVRP